MSPAALAAKWEQRLKREGLAPIDQRMRGRVIVRTQVIEYRPRYVPDPERLAVALEAWAAGDASHFDSRGNELLSSARVGTRRGLTKLGGSLTTWPRRRALVLARICRALVDGHRVAEVARRYGCSEDMAYVYLRPLYAALSENVSPDDDDHERADDAP